MSKKEEQFNTINELEGELSETAESSGTSQPTEPGEIKQALAAKTDEAKEFQDKYLRLAAEFENFKKLAQKQKQEYTQFANESLLKELLPIVDNLERALKCVKGGQGQQNLIQGVELTLKQFLETLAKFGVRPFESVGAVFDPSRHQAVGRQESPTAVENTVLEEYHKGYMFHDRILRPAMVVVAAEPGADTDFMDS